MVKSSRSFSSGFSEAERSKSRPGFVTCQVMPFTPFGIYTKTLRRGFDAAAFAAARNGVMASRRGRAIQAPIPRRKWRRERSQRWDWILLIVVGGVVGFEIRTYSVFDWPQPGHTADGKLPGASIEGDDHLPEIAHSLAFSD